MTQVISTQGALFNCVVRNTERLVLVGVAERCSGSVRVCSPLPGRLKERLSGRRWVLDYVDRGQGVSVYRRGR